MKPSSPHNQEAVPSGNNPAGGPRWAVWLATGFGAGYLPVMPGTYGSAQGVVLYAALAAVAESISWPRLFLCLAALLVTAVSVPVISVALRSFRVQDPAPVVLDEIAGQLLALLPLALIPSEMPQWAGLLAGFLLFRAFDAIKPYPIWKLERLRGALGVVADDVGAGAAAALVLAAGTWFFRA